MEDGKEENDVRFGDDKERKSSRALTYSTDNIFSKPFMSSSNN
jgi:hypothetical protein